MADSAEPLGFRAGQGPVFFAAAHDPKTLQIVPGAGHENVQKTLGLDEFRTLVRTATNAASP